MKITNQKKIICKKSFGLHSSSSMFIFDKQYFFDNAHFLHKFSEKKVELIFFVEIS